jgi:hypothetical protein
VNDENVLDRLKLESIYEISGGQEIAYLASRFDQTPESILRNLSVTNLKEILLHPLLRLKNEDALLNFILSQIENYIEFSKLLPLVRFEFLSNASFARYISWSTDRLALVDGEVWAAVCRRLSLYPPLLPHSNSARHAMPLSDHSKDPQPTPSLPFSDEEMTIERFPFLYGIVASVKAKHGSSWEEHLKVRSSSIHTYQLNYDCKYATNVSPCNGFASAEDISDAWLEYEFVDAVVFPTHYAIRSWFPKCTLAQWPLQWKLQGWTPDGEEIDLDAYTGDQQQSIQDHSVVTFPICRPRAVRRIRLTQIGKNKRGGLVLIISCLEIFGDIIHNN